jgi:hypothetical protein
MRTFQQNLQDVTVTNGAGGPIHSILKQFGQTVLLLGGWGTESKHQVLREEKMDETGAMPEYFPLK